MSEAAQNLASTRSTIPVAGGADNYSEIHEARLRRKKTSAMNRKRIQTQASTGIDSRVLSMNQADNYSNKEEAQAKKDNVVDARNRFGNESLRAAAIKQKKNTSKIILAEQKKRKINLVKETAFSPTKKVSAWWLRMSWLNFISSFGFTLIIIDIIAFAHMVQPNLVCGLGEEWLPEIGGGEDVKKLSKRASGVIGYFERGGLAVLNLGVFFFIIVPFYLMLFMILMLLEKYGVIIKVLDKVGINPFTLF